MKKFVLSVLCFVISSFAAFAASGPLLAPDYNRDGKIDPTDYGRLEKGEAFTIWLNDDDDAEGTDGGEDPGDTNTDLHDVPGGDGNDKDCADGQVNGRCDLLDFFPVLIDVNGVDGSGDYTWKLISKSVNIVFTQLKADTAGSFHTQEVKALDGETPLYTAEVEQLAGDDDKEEEVKLPAGFLVEGRGVIIVEGAAIGEGLTLRGEKSGSDPVEVTLNLRVTNVENMYGWMNLRDKDSTVQPPTSNLQPDRRHFILVHGYNTNHEEARGNAAEFYKKLYQSGSDAMFTAVEWRGDQSQMRFDLLGVTFSPNYFVNVENAFAAARPFAEACKKLPGEKILVAHSLGNMLVSSAIKDFGLDYTKYVMLNAAVAREAYDASAYDKDMVSVLWEDADEEGNCSLTNHLDRASRWYRNFADKKYDPYEYRRKLAWRGRFANLPRTVNYYSPTDNLLANPATDDPDDLDTTKEDDPKLVRELLEKTIKFGGFWSLSEKLKGRQVLIDMVNGVLTNVFEMAESDVYRCEGGWGVNPNYVEGIEFSPANTRFTPFLDERLKALGMLDILPAETERLRAQHLADAIPAESFAAGANEVATLENVNEESFIGENPDWPVYEGEEEHTNEWKHSTFREVAFYHTSKFYASLAAVGKPRVIIDTDLGSSMDDLFTVDLAARMHREGKLDLMAVMMDRPDGCDPDKKGEFLTFADRYLASLGLGDLPIGKSASLPEDQTVFNPYWTLIYSNNLTGVGLLLPTNRTPDKIATFPDAVALYRRLLKDAPDKSVVICSTGFLSNLKGLMESGTNYEGDDIYATGLELIAAKVKELRIMGGCFDYAIAPDGTDGAEYNFAGDPKAAKKVVEEWPTPVVLSTWEVGLKLEYKPNDVLADFPAGTFDPVVRAAYTYWPEPIRQGDRNRLWDPMTVLPLTEGETLVPLSEMGGISVDGNGKTTFTPDVSSNRCYQVSSNMNAVAVMNRYREICRMGNPSVSMLVSGKPEPGLDYNGSELVFKFENIQCGSYSKGDLKFRFSVNGKEYSSDTPVWDETLGVLSVRFEIPPDVVTTGKVYLGNLSVFFANDAIGTNQLISVTRQLVQGAIERDYPIDWFFAYVRMESDYGAWTNSTGVVTPPMAEDECGIMVGGTEDDPLVYMPSNRMPERLAAKVEMGVTFDGKPFETRFLSPNGTAQSAVRIVEDGEGGYKFQFYGYVASTNGFAYRGWWDCNAGTVVPEKGGEYIVRMEGLYADDAQGQLNTLSFSVKDAYDNRDPKRVFVGNLVNENGGVGGSTRLESLAFIGEIELWGLEGYALANVANANLARIVYEIEDEKYEVEYATVAEAVVAADGQPIRLLHAASWTPTEDDIGNPVSFLNKSWLHLDLSGLPANAQAVWTDVDGNDGTLTVELVTADTVVYGTIRTAEEGNPVADALAIADGKYVYVGDEAGVEAFIEDGVTEVIDHRGKGMVMPGCTDGHSHYLNTFAMNNMKGGILFDLGDNKAAVLQKLEKAAREAHDAEKTSLCGFGWNSQIILTNKLSLADLDEVTYGVSAVIYDSSGHHAFCNSECLKRCKIISEDGKTVLITEIDGGLLELKDGYPTGYVNERVTGYLTRMGGINADELIDDAVAEDAICKSQELLLSTGYTTALDAWSNNLHPNKFHEVAHRMDTNGVLKLVLPMTYEVEPWQTNMINEIDYLASLKKTYWTRHVRPEYLKVFMDGVVEARTGATIEPYNDKSVYPSFWSTNRLAEITKACNAKGLTVHTHTMGDAAIRDVTDAYIQGGDGAHRNCLVHLRNVRKEDFQRIAKNNIACAAGPTWHTMDTEFAGMLRQFLCDEYVDHAYPIKSFFDAGIRVSSHSDYPANKPSPQDPFGMMHVAVNGMVPDPGEHDYQYDTDELITVEQAFQALTINGAWQLGLENERGSIAVGKWADFVLADQDVFTCAATDIGKTKVVSTWFEGEKVYQKPDGREESPWLVGATNAADVVAWTNANGRLVIDGKGAMMDFDPFAPWAGDTVTECLVGSDVTSVGAKAFAGCTGLKTLVLHEQTPPTLGADNDLAGVRIFVAAGAADAYRAAWPAFAGQIDEMRSVKGEKIATHLYEMTYKWWDAARANDIGEGLAAYMEVLEWVDQICRHLFPDRLLDWYEGLANRALCTSCRNGNFVGRNFDWGYDDVDECVMHVPAAEGRLESVGVASWFFPQELQDAFDVDEFLPELTMDGINEKGVAINVNVVPGGDNGWTTGTNSNATRRLCAGFAVRTVLDNATNAAHAVEILQSRDIYSLKPLEFHWMISDRAESYIVECASNALVILKAHDARPKMSNYYVSHSPSVAEYDVLTNAELTASDHTPHAMGIERYANVSNGLEQVDSVEAMFTHMTNVWYKLKYLPGNERKYWSDLNGAPIPGKPDGRFTAFDNTAELNEARSNAFTQIQANYVAVTNYEAQTGSRTIDHSKEEWKWLTNGVVHTVHTSIYDLEKRELTVCVQEDAGTIRLRYQDEPYAPVPVMPGSPVTYDSEAMAAKAAGRSVFAPSPEVETKLGKGSDELKAYCGMFGFAVVPFEDGKWAVEAALYPEDWTNVVESAQEATRQIPVAELAAREYGVPLNNVPLTNCVPGFFYSLYDGKAVTNMKANVSSDDCNILCGPDTTVVLPVVPQPAPASGFFSIGVLEVPSVIPGETETSTNGHGIKRPEGGGKGGIL